MQKIVAVSLLSFSLWFSSVQAMFFPETPEELHEIARYYDDRPGEVVARVCCPWVTILCINYAIKLGEEYAPTPAQVKEKMAALRCCKTITQVRTHIMRAHETGLMRALLYQKSEPPSRLKME